MLWAQSWENQAQREADVCFDPKSHQHQQQLLRHYEDFQVEVAVLVAISVFVALVFIFLLMLGRMKRARDYAKLFCGTLAGNFLCNRYQPGW